jgi:hypothetical protein
MNQETLAKSVKLLFGSLPLFFIGPIIINSSFKNQESPYYYPVLAVGIIISFLAVFLLFKGIRTFVNSLFDGNK